jgi:hypothetical protein
MLQQKPKRHVSSPCSWHPAAAAVSVVEVISVVVIVVVVIEKLKQKMSKALN